ncbi:MAG: hypothetical protein GXP42_14910 [Chloroflexi bacterium]|nr:hypothetical protein [Chloroflexota bacterium]
MFGPWGPLIWSLALLAALWWVSRRLAFYFMSTLYALTRHETLTYALYAILILPGTLIHETSHWLMAQLVGVRTGKVSVLPQIKGKSGQLRLGAVDVRGGKLWQHTLIGLAPLLVGSALTVGLSYALVDVEALAEAWRSREMDAMLGALVASLARPDAALGLYLLFTVSDSMFLSASDREPIQRMVLYLGLILAALYMFGLLPALPASWSESLQHGFRLYALGLSVALALHLALTAVFAVIFHVVKGR